MLIVVARSGGHRGGASAILKQYYGRGNSAQEQPLPRTFRQGAGPKKAVDGCVRQIRPCLRKYHVHDVEHLREILWEGWRMAEYLTESMARYAKGKSHR